MSDLPRKAASALGRYLRAHPEEMLRAAKSVAKLELGVPLPALRFLLRELLGDKLPSDLLIEARSSAVFLSASLDLMGTPLKASVLLSFENLDLRPDALLIDLRLQQLHLEVTDDSVTTPLAALLKSGALDLSRPGDLVSYLPALPAFVVETRGDRFRLDFLKHPKLSQPLARKAVAALVPLVSVSSIRTSDDHLDVALRPLPFGAPEALQQWKRLFS